jgi:hypothetical protein
MVKDYQNYTDVRCTFDCPAALEFGILSVFYETKNISGQGRLRNTAIYCTARRFITVTTEASHWTLS